jgi:hypothetical protein
MGFSGLFHAAWRILGRTNRKVRNMLDVEMIALILIVMGVLLALLHYLSRL